MSWTREDTARLLKLIGLGLLLAAVLAGGALAIRGEEDDPEAFCPEGQRLHSVAVSSSGGSLLIDQSKAQLPEGLSFETRSSGEGGRIRAVSDGSSALIQGKDLDLVIDCRDG